jgi:hypothetical protein
VRPGDALFVAFGLRRLGRFQSAPGREAGRCRMVTVVTDVVREFQSAPGREAGRCAALATS